MRNTRTKLLNVAGLALPNSEHLPAIASELPECTAVTSHVTDPFLSPVGGIGCRRQASVSTTVHVPETSMDVDDLSELGHHDIWGAGEVVPM
jgi:hypothetical protein